MRGKSCRGGSDARKTVAPLLAACRKYLPSTLALHSCAKSMLLMTAPHMRLKSAFRQRPLSSAFRSISVCNTFRAPNEFQPANPPSHYSESPQLPFVAPPFRVAFPVVNRAPKRNNESRRPPHIGQGTSLTAYEPASCLTPLPHRNYSHHRAISGPSLASTIVHLRSNFARKLACGRPCTEFQEAVRVFIQKQLPV